MRLLLIHQAFASPNEPGGTRHYEFAQHLVRNGHRFTVVASSTSYLTGKSAATDDPSCAQQNTPDLRILRAYTCPLLHRGIVGRLVALASFMITSVAKSLRGGPADLIMGTSPPIFQALSAWMVAALRRRPFLLEIRDLWPEFLIDIGALKNPVLVALSRQLERFLYSRANHLLVNSPAYHDYLLGKGVAAAKISLIANGVDPDMFDPESRGDSLRHNWGLADKFAVTYAGALGVANDIDTLLQAADRLRDQPAIHFVLVGDGILATRLQDSARQMDLPNVTFMGSRPKNEMPQVLAASDACIAILKDIPMFRTTYPNKVFDYMAAGRPTILAIDGVIRQVVEAAQGGVFVPPGDAAALATAVRHLAGNPQQARAMGLAARSYVAQHFCRRDQAEAFTRLVVRLIDKSDKIRTMEA